MVRKGSGAMGLDRIGTDRQAWIGEMRPVSDAWEWKAGSARKGVVWTGPERQDRQGWVAYG